MILIVDSYNREIRLPLLTIKIYSLQEKYRFYKVTGHGHLRARNCIDLSDLSEQIQSLKEKRDKLIEKLEE
ncbi:hypothetical protein K9L16_03120 [Candidatus Pacearchaeota archaeon]|nr:hypothetical protein [Candidatus Pacearchaeota archaeon]